MPVTEVTKGASLSSLVRSVSEGPEGVSWQSTEG